ncbi:MAG: hypothetical protein NUV49_04210 [Patescibacteria group bacterium]|nr:hypothetical protein [Patescibacteria group bacterium]
MKTLSIFGRRWFRRGIGETYCTAEITVDGVMIHKTAEKYGYDDHYLDIAGDWLETNGFLPDREHHENGSKEALWLYCERKGITFEYRGFDVSRERDL